MNKKKTTKKGNIISIPLNDDSLSESAVASSVNVYNTSKQSTKIEEESPVVMRVEEKNANYSFTEEPTEASVPVPITEQPDKNNYFVDSPSSTNQKDISGFLCLNMIVKNEEKVIQRLLESAAPFIDCYIICDTGSTDNTISIIQSFFKKCNIPGKVIQEPFQDFGYNRSFALAACAEYNIEYVLLLDADMILKCELSKLDFFSLLKDDVYYIFQGTETFFYKNVRIVKNKKDYYYWGVTHEYVKTPEGTAYSLLDKKDVFINDIGDGGCKTDKFVRDIALLKKGLIQNPNNDRYYFYLANSYRDAGQFKEAIDAFKKRIELGGWFDEVWHSYYSIGKCYKNMGDMASAVYWWMEGYNFYPHRIENLYEIVQYYRLCGKNNLAYGFYSIADAERKRSPTTDYLFLQKDIYDYKLDYELSIIGYYCNYNEYDLVKCCTKILNYPFTEDAIVKNVFSNYKFYSKTIGEHARPSGAREELLKKVGKNIDTAGFVSSTPSLCMNCDNELILNTRYVDYSINEKGEYINKGAISTKNIISVFDVSDDANWELSYEFLLNYDRKHDGLYVGLEDVRLFTKENNPTLYFNANRGLDYHNIKVEHGHISMEYEKTDSSLLSFDNNRVVEKNWVLFEDALHNLKTIYNWFPLVIGDVEDSVFHKTDTIETPKLFSYLRGSTNGVRIGNEIWFICHVVSYEDRRHYYHLMVVLDVTDYHLIKYTNLWTFNKSKVEYTLGFVYFAEKNEFLIGYSTLDSTTDFMSVDKKVFDELF